MKESIFSAATNEEMTGGMVKSDYIMKSEALRELEDMVVRNAPIKMRYSCNVMPMRHIDGFTWVEFLGGILVNSSSHLLNRRNLRSIMAVAIPEDIKPFVHEMATVPDKYADYTAPAPMDIDAALILPGNNIIKALVSRHVLRDIPTRYPNARIKPHPVTDDATIAELAAIVPCLPREVSARALLLNPDIKIFTTMASTLAVQAKLAGKEVFNIAERRHRYVAPFQHMTELVMTEYGHVPDLWRLQAVLSNPMSGFFYPGYTTEDDVRNYYARMMTFQPPADELAKLQVEWQAIMNKK